MRIILTMIAEFSDGFGATIQDDLCPSVIDTH